MRHTHRIVSTLRFPRYRQKARAGRVRYTPVTARSTLVDRQEIDPPAAGSGFRVVGAVVQKALLKDWALAGSEGAEDALKVFHRSKLDGDLALLLPQVDLHPRLEAVRQTRRQLAQRRRDPTAARGPLVR